MPIGGRSVGARVGRATLVFVLAVAGSVAAQTVQNPRRIAAGPKDSILVADRRHGAVIAVDRESLETLWSFALPDEGSPFGLAATDRHLYVGNTKTSNVEVYRRPHVSPNGEPKVKFEYNLGHTSALVGNPIDIDVDHKSKRVFVLDGENKQILVFDRRGTFIDAFSPIDQDGELLSPVSLAVDSARQEVLIGDYGDPSGSFSVRKAARILFYSFAGDLVFQIDGDGLTDPSTNFVRVQGMAVGPDGRIFATDPMAGHILVLDRSTGATTQTIGTAGGQPGELMAPLDVWVDAESGDVFVSNNRGARRVEVFRGAGVN